VEPAGNASAALTATILGPGTHCYVRRPVDFARYSRTHRHFRSERLPPLLARVARPGLIADIGAGDGAVLYALSRQGRLGPKSYAIDASPERVAAAANVAPGVVGVTADATLLPLDDESVDGVICSQVIEHVPDASGLVAEIARILRPGGWWYVGSVLRSRHAWWIYRRDGRWWLDPTHVREYASVEEFRGSLAHPELELTTLTTSRFRFPLVELALRAGIALRVVPPRAYRTERSGPALSPPGYRMIEASGRRRAS
jgi:ubiquinone/menaquinone biosynthesis C-methylase UbiE